MKPKDVRAQRFFEMATFAAAAYIAIGAFSEDYPAHFFDIDLGADRTLCGWQD
jgi:hypothetical protein